MSTRALSTARSVCSGRCSASDVYYGVRRHTEDTFHCKCFDRAMGTVVAEVEVHTVGLCFISLFHMQLKESYQSVKHVNCTEAKKEFRDEFIADSDLNTFISESTLGLKTSAGQDNDTQLRVNICNEVRRRTGDT